MSLISLSTWSIFWLDESRGSFWATFTNSTFLPEHSFILKSYGWVGGGPCDFSVSQSPFGLDFGTLDYGTSDLGLTILSRFSRQSSNFHHQFSLNIWLFFLVLPWDHDEDLSLAEGRMSKLSQVVQVSQYTGRFLTIFTRKGGVTGLVCSYKLWQKTWPVRNWIK